MLALSAKYFRAATLRTQQYGVLKRVERNVRSFVAAQMQRPSLAMTETSTPSNSKHAANDLLEMAKSRISENILGRLFAVVRVGPVQYKVTKDDIILVHHNRPLDIGDNIRLEKVLMVGSKDLSIIGRPLLPRDSVTVEAQVVEKTVTAADIHFDKINNKRIRNIAWLRNEVNFILIKKIAVQESVLTSDPMERLTFSPAPSSS